MSHETQKKRRVHRYIQPGSVVVEFPPVVMFEAAAARVQAGRLPGYVPFLVLYRVVCPNMSEFVLAANKDGNQ